MALDDTSRPSAPARGLRATVGAAFAALIAAAGWIALGVDFDRAVSGSLARGLGVPEALFLWFRYFTVLTNIGIALLMSVSAVRLWRGQRLPSPGVYNGGLIYILVTCVTYEVMLRNQWAPFRMEYLTDTVIHDIVPGLTLVFWLAFAPRAGARWRDALWMLVYPAVYFAMTLIAGALGEPYPYNFLDVSKLGYRVTFIVGLVFLAVYYALALVTTGLSKAWAGRESPPVSPHRKMDFGR